MPSYVNAQCSARSLSSTSVDVRIDALGPSPLTGDEAPEQNPRADSVLPSAGNSDPQHLPLTDKVISLEYRDRLKDSLLSKRYEGNTSSRESLASFQPWTTTQRCQYPIPGKEDPWQECFNLVLKFDDEMCRGWREEIDTLLVFAGLFSAAVTAFTIESYRWLQEDPQTAQIQLLQSIANHLTNGSSVDSVLSPSAAIFSPSPSSVRVNIFWFTSLTLSLSAVLIGILCKQWLREYQRYEGLSANIAFPVRQLRYEGLLAWQVPKILSSLPLILQTALVLFFAGLLDLLWSINALMGSILTVFVGIVLIALIATTVLPSFQSISHISTLWSMHIREPSPQCAFKSPQSWAFHLLLTWLVSLYSTVKQQLFYGTVENYLQLQLSFWNSEDANWVKYDQRWQAHGKYMQRGINWFDKTFARGNHNVDAIYSVFRCLESLETGISAACVSNIIEDNWNPLVPLVGLIRPTLQSFQDPALPYDVTADFARDMVLASYLLVHHKASSALSLQCMERCTRMLNCLPSSQNLAATVLEMLSIVVPTPTVPEELSVQLISALAGTLISDAVSQSDLATFWSILQHIPQKHEMVDIPLHSLFSEMESWLRRKISSPTVSIADKQIALRQCSLGVLSLYSMTKLQQSSWDMKSSRTEGSLSSRDVYSNRGGYSPRYLQSFITLLDQSIDTLGGSALILSWGTGNWNSLKEQILGTEGFPPI